MINVIKLPKSKKTKHLDFIHDRMVELHNEIREEVIHAEDICVDTLTFKRNLIKKYRRRVKLLNT